MLSDSQIIIITLSGNALTRICGRKAAVYFNEMKLSGEWYEPSIEKMVYDCCTRRIPVSPLSDLALVVPDEVPIIEFCTF